MIAKRLRVGASRRRGASTTVCSGSTRSVSCMPTISRTSHTVCESSVSAASVAAGDTRRPYGDCRTMSRASTGFSGGSPYTRNGGDTPSTDGTTKWNTGPKFSSSRNSTPTSTIGADSGADADPGTNPGIDPGTDSGADLCTAPGADPGTDAGTNPGIAAAVGAAPSPPAAARSLNVCRPNRPSSVAAASPVNSVQSAASAARACACAASIASAPLAGMPSGVCISNSRPSR